MTNNNETYFLDLLGLKLSGDATEDQLAELNALIRENPSFLQLHDQITAPVFSTEDFATNADQAYASHYVKMQLRGLFDKSSNLPEENIISKPLFARKKLFLTAMGAAVFVLFFIFLASIINIVYLLNHLH